MLFAAYLVLVISVVVWMRDADVRHWTESARRSTVLAARVGGVLVTLNLAVVGLLLVRTGELAITLIVGAALVVGGASLVLGFVVWEGVAARGLRRGGWVVVVAVLCIPSTLTLLLLAAAPLLFLALAPARRDGRLRSARAVG